MKRQLVPDLWGDVYIIPGVIDDEAVTAFTTGHCHSLAVAIHETTGWELVKLGYEDLYADSGQRFIHYAVRTPNGTILDIEGEHHECEIEDAWEAAVYDSSLEELEEMIANGEWNPIIRRELAEPFVAAVLKEVA